MSVLHGKDALLEMTVPWLSVNSRWASTPDESMHALHPLTPMV